MFKSIMVPVDLGHKDKLEKALKAAATFSKEFGARITLVGVTATLPTSVAHNPEEYAEKLKSFADENASSLGVAFQTKMVTTGDPIRDLDRVLEDVVNELGVDLVVMATHIPGAYDHVFSSNAGYLASHSHVSVFVVRG